MRVVWELPITGPILKLIGCELIIEDHDLVGPRWGLSMMELIVYRHTSTTKRQERTELRQAVTILGCRLQYDNAT